MIRYLVYIDKDRCDMTPADKRQELQDRVSLAISDNYKTKQETQKRKKCSVCGKGYLGQAGANTCGPTCRKRKSRS